jgi:lipopolysaccharide/colanic/teichoic acid biosynthesis glycosyltransferase
MKRIYNSKAANIHHLKSKTCQNGKILFVTNYDYFLNKRDLKIILSEFQEILLLPKKIENFYFSDEELKEILYISTNITLIFNPLFENRVNQLYENIFKENKTIEAINVFRFCEERLKKCYISNNIYDLTPDLDNLHYFGIFPRLFKKTLDICIGSLLWVSTQPLWLFSAFKIIQESPGPVFFKQKRVGIRNGEFAIIKFRSMGLDAEINGAQFSSKNDDRVFAFGKFMRKTRIDELPQLINIIKGELSLIGPRPERKVFIETFEEEIPHYNKRHAVKSGISGYAQVMYTYGSGISDARHKLMYDLYYIKNWSLKLELEIILRTAWTIISKRGI